ncbi:hypothetical protein ISN44_As11g029270 [Arabidopsis suecica]|uniref:Transposon protein, putative, CACTA, En/Spm sub-class n=1 Tax=Arabidopsis suecica TaxID=45249 RepID=A0A8T1ZFX4_ARASU|nr:hypothetical protein ISN44_As11g029270 [Arabidopsis suecica]
MDKAWVWLPRNSLEYEEGATKFVLDAASCLGNVLAMFCPCVDCRNVVHQSNETVLEHLVIRGMDLKYKRSKCGSKHGEISDKTTDVHASENEAYDLFRTAFMESEGKQSSQQNNVEESETVESKEEGEFRKKLEDAETPLYSTCMNYTKVSAIMGLYRIKVKSGMSENFFDQLLTLVHDMLPGDNMLPKSTNDMKKFLKIFGFGYDSIHACRNDCILYRNQYEELVSCPRCSESRWEKDKHTGEEKKGIPAKVLSQDGTMRHPVDSLTWVQVNDKWPEFAAEARNLRLGLSTDGMNPFSIQNTKYSTWPVLLVNYNMAPTECMKAENIMLTMLIPGPTAPSKNIDVYLQLIDDLKDLWNEGMVVYDSFKKESFTLRAMLLWSITDYPALGTLAGCKMKGKQACNVCGKDTPHRWLKFSRKHVYMGNRRRLRPDHPYRRRKVWFDNTVELGTANRIQSGAEIYECLRDFRNEFGRPLEKKGKRKRMEADDDDDDDVIAAEEYEENDDQWRWKKMSIFFQLAYWKDLPVRHNIDVMHVEKNVSDALLSILMHNGKSKDGLKARKDLEDIGIRTNLHTQKRGKRTYLPPAAYWLSKEEKRKFCRRLSKFRGPDGYCANISNCVSVDPPNIGSMKSHDHHVMLQNLFPVALRGLLPRGPRIAVSRICNFFNRLCQRVIDPEKLVTLESEVIETMCQLERYFPPSLFDIMFHLPIHLAREARLGGPVHFRWMYLFERYMKTLKAYVKNFARPEACMAEGYLAGECIAFCLEFLQKSVPVQETLNRNEDLEADQQIFEGRPLHLATEKTLTDKERDIAHRYILMNTAVMEPYIELHLEELQATDIPSNSKDHSSRLRWLAFGPRHIAQTYKGSSAKDTRQMADIVSFYGVIKEILMLDYHMFQIPVFRLNKFFYSREDDSSPWYVCMRAPPRGYHELETVEEFVSGPLSVQPIEDLGDQSSDDESFCVRSDCEGLDVTPVVSLKKKKRNKKSIIEENERDNEEERIEVATEGDDGVEEEDINGEEDIEEQENGAEDNEEQDNGQSQENERENEKEDPIPPSTAGASETQTNQSDNKKRKSRGPTRMRKVAKNLEDKVEVEFNALGEHVGKGSVTLSSFLGPLAREHVPVLLDDWRQLDQRTKDVMWEEIQGRFNLKEDWQKEAVFKQMGGLWRAAKSKLVTKVRSTKSKVDLQQLKPSNVQCTSAWNSWVKNKCTAAFKERSEKYRQLRKGQIPHTTSRKGMTRLADEMKKNSSDPRKVTRSKVWIAGHTHSDGRPVREEFAETIEMIKTIDSEMDSTTSTDNVMEDAVSQRQTDDVSMSDLSNVSKGGVRCQLLDWCSNVEVVVGEGEFCSSEHTYKIGRIPLGRNAAAVLVKSTTVIHASVWRPTPTIFTLNEAVGHKIAWPLDKIILDEDINLSQPTKSVESEQPTDESLGRIKIFQYWSGDDDLIAEGMLLSTDHNELVDGRPLGHGAAVVKVLEVVKPEAYLWRPNPPISLMSDALNETIAWPIDRIQLLDVPANDESTRKSPQSATTPSSTTPSTASSKGAKQKCFLLDIDNTGQRVAIGRVSSTDPAEKVHHVPLGANASKVWVEVSKVEGARVWRANSEVKFIADAVGTTVAWPNDKIIFM